MKFFFRHNYSYISFVAGKCPGIYIIYETETGKFYVGSSKNTLARIRNHFSNLRHNKHANKHLQNAFNKYSEKRFSYTVVEKCCVENLIELEQKWIDLLSAVDYGYNIKPMADSSRISEETKEKMRGRYVSEETRKKISESTKDRLSNPENNPMYGKHHTEETVLKIKKSKSANDVSGENNPFYGKKHTQETKDKISIANKGKKKKISTENVIEIKKMICNGMSNEEIAKKFNISKYYVRKIRYREVYSDVGINCIKGKSKKLTFEQVREIRKMIADGVSALEIASKFGVRRSTIYSIKNFRIWREE